MFFRVLPLALLPLIAAFSINAMAGGKPTRGTGIKPEVLFHNYCSVCHGDRGDGNSRASNSLNPPPRNFLLSNNTNLSYIEAAIRDGIPGTAMVGWGSQLNAQEVKELAAYVQKNFMAALLNPRIQQGKAIYVKHCLACHGERGEGVPQGGANKPPRNLASPKARDELDRAKMIDAVVNGKSGTLMISYRSLLKKSEIEAVVDYIDAILMVPASQISGTKAHGGRQQDAEKGDQSGFIDMKAPLPNGLKGDYAKGKAFFLANCADCHGPKGDGQGKRAYFINPRPANFLAERTRNRLNRPAIFVFTSQGKLGTEMPAWNKVLSDQEIANVAEYVFKAYIEPGESKAQSSAKK
jgi:cytochrome c oxidase cbb3-type subunit III